MDFDGKSLLGFTVWVGILGLCLIPWVVILILIRLGGII